MLSGPDSFNLDPEQAPNMVGDTINNTVPQKDRKFTFGGNGGDHGDSNVQIGIHMKSGSVLDERNAWRAEQDPHKLYQIDKYFRIGNIVEKEVAEQTRWKKADAKGNRKSKQFKFYNNV
jgi:hypothetical protein